MNPEFSTARLRQTRVVEYLVRFVFGGVVSVCAWLVAGAYGPVLGGFFLAFPALLPASLTLIKEHDGRAAAMDDARGAAVGSVGMSAFGLVVWATGEMGSLWLTLALALMVWVIVSVGAWWLLLRPEADVGHERCSTSEQPQESSHEQQIRT